jgi:heat shock protein HslJ
MWGLGLLGGFIVILVIAIIYLLISKSTASAVPTPQPTGTPLPSPTLIVPTWTPVPPTDTPTVTPTQAIPTPTQISGDPAAILGRPSGVDTFDNANNWTLFNSDCFKSEIVGGEYVMTAKGQQGMSCWEVTWPMIQDFYLQTDMQMPDACQTDDRFGLIFRAPDNLRGYLYGLTCDGRFTMTAWDGTTTQVLVDLTSNPAIKAGAGQVNRIGVLANGTYFALYANGVQLTALQDSTFPGAGKIGYFVRAASPAGFTVKFDNLSVWLFNQPNAGSERGFLPGVAPTLAAPTPTFNPTFPVPSQAIPTYVGPAYTPTPTPKFVSGIIGPTWRLVRYTDASGTETPAQDPNIYWIKFNPDGTLNTRGDCNTAYGVYTLKEEKLTIDLTGGTTDTCTVTSFSSTYFDLLESVTSYTLSGNRLVLNLGGGGNFRFSP